MDAVDRMFHTLVRALRSHTPPADAKSFSAGELHDRILPYRHFRRELNLDSNREYELTLMELLSGARGYLDVDERLKDVLTKELSTTLPDPGRLRDVADAEFRLSPTKKGLVPVARPSGAMRAEASECAYCNGALPFGRALHYCPHCGQNLQVATCNACGAEIEADWRHCVVCGKAAPEPAS